MSDANNLVYICVHCGQVVENKDSEWHERQCPEKVVNIDDDQEDVELNVEEVEEEMPEEKQVEKDDYVLRLINAVRLRTILWDKYQKRDLPARKSLWLEIEQELGTQPDVPRRDWTHLREKYRGERTTLKKASQAGRKLEPRWEYYNHMTFLEQDGTSKPKKTVPTKSAPKLIASKVVTINGKKVLKKNYVRGKPGPKPGSHRTVKKAPISKPITRPKRDPKPPAHLTDSRAVTTVNNARNFGQLNELRVVVPRNDYRDLHARKNGNSVNVGTNEANSRKRSNVNSQQDVDAAAVSFKQVCIRNNEEAAMNSGGNSGGDTVGRFCSYLEVMLRTLPKEKQEVFYEETLDHLATLKRQIRRSNHSNPTSNYM
ncbi:uncharacterized protein LOC117174401 [Belonocnema kinseyi]|uniref:uncharacterized protein LOC117174401 n=1 Tax=Belonocnema kinseyi TaxID=2817044 RepID=UPI00143DA541|nr:uncharacterized protein LOC117174401 [Belonocnema kinseyi]